MSSSLDKLLGLLKMFESLEEENGDELKDSWKVGPASDRKKLYLDFDDPELVKRKIDNAVGASEYYQILKKDGVEDEGELEEIEKERMKRFEKFLERATNTEEEEAIEEEAIDYE